MKPLPPSGAAIPYEGPRPQRDHLEPGRRPRAGEVPRTGGRAPRGPLRPHRRRSVPDLLDNEPERMLGGHGVVVRLCERKGDVEKRHADPVVKATLDVQALPDPHRETGVGDDGLAEGGIGRREDDRKDERLGQSS